MIYMKHNTPIIEMKLVQAFAVVILALKQIRIVQTAENLEVSNKGYYLTWYTLVIDQGVGL